MWRTILQRISGTHASPAAKKPPADPSQMLRPALHDGSDADANAAHHRAPATPEQAAQARAAALASLERVSKLLESHASSAASLGSTVPSRFLPLPPGPSAIPTGYGPQAHQHSSAQAYVPRTPAAGRLGGQASKQQVGTHILCSGFASTSSASLASGASTLQHDRSLAYKQSDARSGAMSGVPAYRPAEHASSPANQVGGTPDSGLRVDPRAEAHTRSPAGAHTALSWHRIPNFACFTFHGAHMPLQLVSEVAPVLLQGHGRRSHTCTKQTSRCRCWRRRWRRARGRQSQATC